MKKGFIWGAATASYQIEGGWNEDGKGLSIWDVYTHNKKCYREQNADTACDSYHRYKEDVSYLKKLGVNAYRFSISWPRIFPDGKTFNEKGFEYYDNLINELLKNGIEPYLTLYHWDMPQEVNDNGGFFTRDIIDFFSVYTQAVVDRYKEKVKNYITINEPQCVLNGGLFRDDLAPGANCSIRELLSAGHNLLLCHGEATKIIRKTVPNAKIGIAFCGWIPIPATDDKETEDRAFNCFFDVYKEQPFNCMSVMSDAIFFGDYPKEYYELYKNILPEIKSGDMEIISQPLDFQAQNVYSGFYLDKNGTNIGFPEGSRLTACNWDVVPESVYYAIKFLYRRYKLPVIITENGTSCFDWLDNDGTIKDYNRIQYLREYLLQIQKAEGEDIPVIGYFYWSLMDNFEWKTGFSQRFGLLYMDYKTLERTPKLSFNYYKDVIKRNKVE